MHSFDLKVNGFVFGALASGPADGELVLLLHGFPQFADAWIGVMERLAGSGFRAVAVSQRGYSPGARPGATEAYAMRELVTDAMGFADALGAERFHLAGHDWGGAVAWVAAAQHAETTLLAFDAKALRGAYQGKVPPDEVERNVQHLQGDGALTAALNWYRANAFQGGLGSIRVPTLYVWSDKDVALGEAAALDTGSYVEAPYRFVRLAGVSHWVLDEAPEQVSSLMLEHFRANAAS